MDRIYGTLELRATNDELREFSGIANTATEDDHGTIVEPSGAKFKLPIPLLWQHDQKTPVGEIYEAALVGGAWHVKGRIATVKEPGKVKDATDQAWHSIKYKLVRGLSIGFQSLKEKGNRFIEWLLREISLVTIPSNMDANIVSVRASYLAASGEPIPASRETQPKPRPRMTISEQITQFENTRAAKVAQRDALLEKSGAEGATLDESEAETFDTLDKEVRSIDDHLVRLNSAKKDIESRAVPISQAPSLKKASETRSGVQVVHTRDKKEAGLGFARYCMSLAACRGNRYEAAAYAKQTFGSGDVTDEVVMALETRAAVAPGTTVQATFALPLVQTNFLNEFLELLRPQTLVGRIPGLKHVPFNVSMPAQTAGGTYSWVGEGLPKPVTNAQFASVTLGMFKAAGIIVLTKELVKTSSPNAQEVVRTEMIDGITRFLDGQFIDPAVAAGPALNPASITNTAAGTVASGPTEAAARADLRLLIKTFVTNNLGIAGLVLLMNESVAFTLGTMVNAVGAPAFPGIGPLGGSILGIPVVTSNTVTAAIGIVAVHAPSVLIADEGGIEIDISDQASLQMDGAPAAVPDATHIFKSLWQMNLVGLRVERFISWGKARATAVDRIHTVAYV